MLWNATFLHEKKTIKIPFTWRKMLINDMLVYQTVAGHQVWTTIKS